MGLFNFFKSKEEKKVKLNRSVSKTSSKIYGGISSIFLGRKKIDEELLEEIEELLISADIGVVMVDAILESVRKESSRGELKDVDQLVASIKKVIIDIIDVTVEKDKSNDNNNDSDNDSDNEKENNIDSYSDTDIQVENEKDTDIQVPYQVLVVGVNGVGKTTTIAKLSNIYKASGYKVLIAAADTFRAAAVEQLAIWAGRIGVDIVTKDEGTDPASVVYTAIERVEKEGYEVLIVDTAGRLHNKVNLMQELLKMEKVATKNSDTGFSEKLLVIDATSGQNAITQARAFNELIGLTGLIVTKLDGTAKGGVVINIINELKIPVKFICIGESVEDIIPFNAEDFVDAVFSNENLTKENT